MGSRSWVVQKLTDFLIAIRWIFVVPIVLPMSFMFEMAWNFRNWFYYKFLSSPERHNQRVEDIQRRIVEWDRNGRKGLLCTARKNWLNMSIRYAQYKKNNAAIPIELYDILHIDTDEKFIRVEPLVTMGQITKELIPRGYTLPVVPEMDDLTVSGLILGYGIEGSSHKYGLFCDVVKSMDVVLGDGRLVTCSREENADLFHALPWSYGSLGFVVSVDIQIVPCKPWVELTYVPVKGFKEYFDKIEYEFCREDPHEFVEGLMYNKEEGVIMVGDFLDVRKVEPSKINRVGWWWKPWFYKHAQSFLEKGQATEHIPIREYYHRHTRSIFWEGELIVPFGNSPLFRLFLGWLMPPKVSFLRLTEPDIIHDYYVERHVVQDGLVPVSKMAEAADYFHQIFECYPLWICPHKLWKTKPQGMLSPSDKKAKEYEMYVDLGYWFVPGPVWRGEPYDSETAVRKFQDYLIKNHGYQCLYTIVYLTKEEHAKMFDLTLYNKVRQKYKADGAFLHVYDKIKKQ